MREALEVLRASGFIENGLILIVVIFFYFFIKKRSGEMNFISKSHDSIINANERFRNEIRKDLEVVKKEKNDLIKKLELLEEKLFHLGQENIALKKRELELTQEIHDLKKRISGVNGACKGDDCTLLLQYKEKIAEYELEIARLKGEIE